MYQCLKMFIVTVSSAFLPSHLHNGPIASLRLRHMYKPILFEDPGEEVRLKFDFKNVFFLGFLLALHHFTGCFSS